MEGARGGSTTRPAKKQTRTRTGCLNCRRKKRKCDEGRPVCGTCRRRNEHCEWGLKISFRAENAQGIDAAHPSMRRVRPPREFEIMDVTHEVIQDYHQPVSWAESDNETASITDYRGYYTERTRNLRGQGNRRAQQDIDPFQETPDVVSPTSQLQTESAVANLLYLSQGGPSQTAPLNPDMQLPDSSLQMDFMTDYSFMDQTPDATPNHDLEHQVSLSGSAFHELHAVLRKRLVQGAMYLDPTQPATSQLNSEWGQDFSDFNNVLKHSAGTHGRGGSALPPDNVVCDLWRNWFGVVAPWLDKFKGESIFRDAMPSLAREHSHVRYAMLALSARQLELTGSTLASGYSLALSQDAVRQLLPHLATRNNAVLATCVILCLQESLNSAPDVWQQNLDGCTNLLQGLGISCFDGGIGEALFWSVTRMDVGAGLALSQGTRMPVSSWSLDVDMDAACGLFKGGKNVEQWSKYATYLAATVLDLLAPLSTDALNGSARNDPKFRESWLQIWKHICEWYHERPAQMHPAATLPSSSKYPFPTILFSNPAAVSGTQLHHTASILMLQNQPLAVRLNPRPRSILWHARQICGIGISNEDQAAWLDGVQPLVVAGRCMSNPSEHRAILELLGRVRRESGWRTEGVEAGLKEFWGDLED